MSAFNEVCSVSKYCKGRRGCDRVVGGFKLHVQSVHITINVVSSNPARGEVYSI